MTEPTEKDISHKKETHCSMCGKPSFDTICDVCKARVTGQAVEIKHQVDREGKIDTGRK